MSDSPHSRSRRDGPTDDNPYVSPRSPDDAPQSRSRRSGLGLAIAVVAIVAATVWSTLFLGYTFLALAGQLGPHSPAERLQLATLGLVLSVPVLIVAVRITRRLWEAR